MKTYDVKQGGSEWGALRLGIVTASEMKLLVTPNGKVRTGEGVESYLYRKVCERVLGFSPESGSWAMEQGTILEAEARPWYAFSRDVDVATPGFCTTDDGLLGASPDGLVGKDGGLEIKSFQPCHSLEVLMKNEVPDGNIVQIQTCLIVSGRKWWDFVSYSRQFPNVVIRCTPDEKIQKAIRDAHASFLTKFDAAVAKVTALREEQNMNDPRRKAHEAEVAAWKAVAESAS